MNLLSQILYAINSDDQRLARSLALTGLDTWASLNGLKRSGKHFGLVTLAHASVSRLQYQNDDHAWPSRDHVMMFRRKAHPSAAACITTQPYTGERPYPQIEELRAYLRKRDLVAHVPPNPFASFWYPGRTLFVAIVRPDTPIQWLPDQLDFKPGSPAPVAAPTDADRAAVHSHVSALLLGGRITTAQLHRAVRERGITPHLKQMNSADLSELKRAVDELASEGVR